MSNEGTSIHPAVANNVEYDRAETPDSNHLVSGKSSDDFLNPNLEFNKDVIATNLYKSDQAFAREAVNLIAQAAMNGVFACANYGYQFQELPVLIIVFHLICVDG